MMPDEWVMRLCTLVRRYKPGDGLTSFRNDYSSILERATRAGAITKDDTELLLKARSHLEAWTSPKPPEPLEAYRQWMDLYETGRPWLPELVLQTLLGRFPKYRPGQVDWAPLVLGKPEKGLLSVLLARRLISPTELGRIAKAKPSEFYRSAALDVLVERRGRCPRMVWDAFSKGEGRPADLLDAHEAFVRCFTADRSADATRWLVRFLANSPAVREPVLGSLLKSPDATFRLSRHLTLEHTTFGGAKRRKPQDRAIDVLIDWLDTCKHALDDAGETAPTASIVVGLVRFSASVDSDSLPARALAALPDGGRRLVEQAAVMALRRAEAQGGRGADSFVLVASGNDLYQAVQEYLRMLPLGTGRGDDSPERALRFERYLGRKEVIQGLLSALEMGTGEGPLRDAVEVALYNASVRPYCDVGQEVSFDTHSHEPEVPGIVPGDPVLVTRPGRRLGAEEDAIVLVKARVKPLAQHHE